MSQDFGEKYILKMLHEARLSEKVVGSDQTFVANRLRQIVVQSDWSVQELQDNYKIAFEDAPHKMDQRNKLYMILEKKMSAASAEQEELNQENNNLLKVDLEDIKKKAQMRRAMSKDLRRS